MKSEAQKRVQLFLEAAAAPKKKPQPKKVSGKTPGAFHDKLDQKLSTIAKKYGVKITLQRNKTKLPGILISGLKSLTFDKVSELFQAIPNTSHVPNKIGSNSALFRVFGPNKPKTMTAKDTIIPAAEKKMLLDRTKKALKDTHEKFKKSKDAGEKAYLKRVRKSLFDNVKMLKKIGHTMSASEGVGYLTTASEDPQYVVTAKKNGKRVYWKEDGFTALTAKDAEPLDEETADKVERRLKNKGDYTDIKTIPFKMTADDTDDNSSDDDTSDDDSEDTDTDNSSDDSGDDEDDSAEDDSNKADMVKFISDNKISKDSLASLIDKAASSYTDSLKTDAPIEDVVDFIYEMLGPDDAKTGLKALANKASMSSNNE